MLAARNKAGLTQGNVAHIMGAKAPVITRLETAGDKHPHPPTLDTLHKYAHVVGYRLVARLKHYHAMIYTSQ